MPDTQKYIHVIVNGDTPWNLSRRYQCSVQELAGLNGIKDPNKIFVGTELKIPQN